MAVIEMQGADGVRLSDAQTGNGDSTNIARRGVRDTTRQATLVLTTTVGATPTVTINIQGSGDGVNWVNIPYSAENTISGTWVTTALTITTAKTGFYNLQPDRAWRFLKLAYSANTNVTTTADAYL
jgi:hypothetical protein